jgi:hypothetical protein
MIRWERKGRLMAMANEPEANCERLPASKWALAQTNGAPE